MDAPVPEGRRPDRKPRGGEDALNLGRGSFPSRDALGIPLVRRDALRPAALVPYRQKLRPSGELPGGSLAVHFFLDDERFEAVWSRPLKGLSYVRGLGCALTPDFSLYPDMPLALQLFNNVYRNRWCGAFWQERGVRVVPTVGWSDEESFAFCFLGVERGATVAVSTVGLVGAGATDGERDLFRAGYERMVETLSPCLVLVYGDSSEHLIPDAGGPPTRSYPSRWKGIREARRRLLADGDRRAPEGAEPSIF